LIVIKSPGVGIAIAVLLDAAIIRALLVPATMRLLGHWAWWAPSRLAGFSGQLGFSHVETEYECNDNPEAEIQLDPPRVRLGGPKSESAAG
jgi:MMPL family